MLVWGYGRLSAPLTDEKIDHIRQQFTPEVIVPTAFTVRQPIERHTEAELGLTQVETAQGNRTAVLRQVILGQQPATFDNGRIPANAVRTPWPPRTSPSFTTHPTRVA